MKKFPKCVQKTKFTGPKFDHSDLLGWLATYKGSEEKHTRDFLDFNSQQDFNLILTLAANSFALITFISCLPFDNAEKKVLFGRRGN